MSSLGKATEAGTVHVCGVEYRVMEGTELEVNNPNDEGPVEVRGAVNPYISTVILDYSLSKSQKELTFLHELVHAIDDTLGIDLSEPQTKLLASGLYSLQYKGPKARDKTRTMRGVFYG